LRQEQGEFIALALSFDDGFRFQVLRAGEEVETGSEIGLWLYPKGQEPKKRSYLIGFTGLREREFLDIPPNSIAYTEGFTVLKENTMITNFQPHFHLRGKAMIVWMNFDRQADHWVDTSRIGKRIP